MTLIKKCEGIWKQSATEIKRVHWIFYVIALSVGSGCAPAACDDCIGRSRGDAASAPPQWDPILSFLHFFSKKVPVSEVGTPKRLGVPPPTGNLGSATGLNTFSGSCSVVCSTKLLALQYLSLLKTDHHRITLFWG